MGAVESMNISTVLPVLNEVKYIDECINSLIEQTYPADQHTVLVIDGGSTDGTIDRIEQAIERSKKAGGPVIELHHNHGKFVAQGRNLALTLLPDDTTHVLELIGHSTVEPHHLLRLSEEWFTIAQTEPRELAALGSRVLPRKGQLEPIESWIEATLASPLGSGGGQFDGFTKAGPCRIPAFVLHSRQALTRVGGWDESFISSQDSDLSMRLSAAGFALWRTPETTVHMTKRTGLRRWWRMGHRYGFWRTKTVLKHPRRISVREYLPWFGLLLTLGLFFLGHPLATVPLAAYGLVLGFEAIRMTLRFRRISLLIGVPLCLFMLHSSFSIGLVDGLLRKGRAASDR